MRLIVRALIAATLAGGILSGVGCTNSGGGAPVVEGVESLIIVKRAFLREDGSEAVMDGNTQVFDYGRYVPPPAGQTAGVFVLTPPRQDGTLRNLTAAFTGVDVNGIDLSFDARQVVFSMRHAGDNRYHLYVANVDGSGSVRQLTFGEADDVTPIYVPASEGGGRIAFVTNDPYDGLTVTGTRADEYNHSRGVAQIATVSVQGGDADRRLCSHNLSNSINPFLMSDGRIGFSRWEHLGPVNDVKLFAMNPDCTQMIAVAGQFNKPFNSIVQAQEIANGQFIAIGTSRNRTVQGGALVRVDARNQTGNPNIPIDVQQARFDIMTPAVPTSSSAPPTGVGRYRSPRALPGSTDLLVSWADGDVNDRLELANTAPNFGVYLFNPNTRERRLVYDDPNMWDLYAIPVAPRDQPPVRAGNVGARPDPTMPATIGGIDITQTSLTDRISGAQFDGVPLSDALRQATHVRISEGFSSEIGAVGQFGLTMFEGMAVLGEVPVNQDGSWRANVPAYLPYQVQAIDRFGLAIRSKLLWIQAMPGEQRTCGGCHESRSNETLPRSGVTTIAQQMPPANLRRPIPERLEFPWYSATANGSGYGAAPHTNIQDLFDAKCVSCHSGQANDPFRGQTYTVSVTPLGATAALNYTIPILDLSNRPVEAYYEREVVTYPASYVSLLYPSAMMMGVQVTGGVQPIRWVDPGSARQSRLIEQVNAVTEAGDEWAWQARATGMAGVRRTDRPAAAAGIPAGHPEDVGGAALTREERMMLVRMADLGGQYYSRRNVSGGAWGTAPDPAYPTN